MDDLPLTVDVGFLVGRHRHLTASSSVRGTTGEAEDLRDADWHVVHGGNIIDARALFAGKVGAGGPWCRVVQGAVVETGFAIGNGAVHDHVSVGEGGEKSKGRSREQRFCAHPLKDGGG